MAIITISRGTFSGGSELATRLGELLGYDVLSREVLAQAAVRYGVSEAKLAKALERGPGFWDRFLHDRRLYLAFILEALCERVQSDRIIYHGHAGHLLLRGVRHVLRVRLIAPLEYRIAQVEERMHLTRDDAIRHIERVDRERASWTKFLYGVEWNDPSLYDLTLNLEHLDLGGAADVVEVIGSFTSEMELEQWATLCPKEDVEYFLEEVMKKHRLGCPEKDLLVVYRLRVTAPSPADEKEQLPVVRVRAYRRLTQEQRDAYLSEGEVSPDGMCARQGVERRAPAPVSSWERPMLPAPAAIEEGVAALVERTPCFRPGQLAA